MLKIAATADEFDALPSDIQSHYAQQDDGSYNLAIDGEHPEVTRLKAKVSEFRTNNANANNTILARDETLAERATKITALEASLAAVKEIDPVEYQKAKDELAALKSAGIDKPDAVKVMIADALKSATEPLRTEVQTLRTDLNTSKQEREAADVALRKEKFGTLLTDAATKAGVQPTALVDIRQRAAADGWTFVDGTLQQMRGETVVVDDEGSAVTIAAWLGDTAKNTAPHLFGETSGSGAGQAGGGGAGARPGDITIPAGTKVLRDPSDDMFGDNLEAIAGGKMIVEHSA